MQQEVRVHPRHVAASILRGEPTVPESRHLSKRDPDWPPEHSFEKFLPVTRVARRKASDVQRGIATEVGKGRVKVSVSGFPFSKNERANEKGSFSVAAVEANPRKNAEFFTFLLSVFDPINET